MADLTLKRKIRNTLRRACFNGPQDRINVSDGDSTGSVHLVVISPKFKGRRPQEKIELILSHLYHHLSPDEWGTVTLAIGVSPSEVNGASFNDIKLGM